MTGRAGYVSDEFVQLADVDDAPVSTALFVAIKIVVIFHGVRRVDLPTVWQHGVAWATPGSCAFAPVSAVAVFPALSVSVAVSSIYAKLLSPSITAAKSTFFADHRCAALHSLSRFRTSFDFFGRISIKLSICQQFSLATTPNNVNRKLNNAYYRGIDLPRFEKKNAS